MEISGGVGEVKIRMLLRDFDTARLADHAARAPPRGRRDRESFPQARIDFDIKRSYLNMADGLRGSRARSSMPIRPSPGWAAPPANDRPRRHRRLAADGTRPAHAQYFQRAHSIHSPKEWASLDEMMISVQWIIAIAETWAAESG